MGFADDVVLAVRSAPEAYRDPSIALAAASLGGDVQGNAEVAAYAGNSQSIARAANDVADRNGGRGAWGATLSWLGGGIKGAMDFTGDAVGAALKISSMPLQQVQQSYRFLRDVEARHGIDDMLMAAVPQIIGGVAGFAVAGPWGASGGQFLAGQLHEWAGGPYKDSWERTASADYVDPHGGQAVSPGRDAARFLGSLSKHIGINIEQQRGFDLYDAVSSLGDGLFTVTADPLMAVGGLRKAAYSEKGMRGALRHTWGGIPIKADDLARLVADDATVAAMGTQIPPEMVQAGLQKVLAQPIVGRNVRRRLQELADMETGEIIARHKKLAPFAVPLGKAKTVEEVGQVLADHASAAQMRIRTLPRAGVANAPFGAMVEEFQQKATDLSLTPTPEDASRGQRFVAGQKRRAGETFKRVTTFVPTSFNETTGELSRTTLYLNDPGSSRTIYDMAKWGHNEQTARLIAADWATATIDDRMTMFRNLSVNNMINRMEAVMPGWQNTSEGQEAIMRIGDQIDIAFGGIDAGKTTAFGFDAEGRIISRMPHKGQTESHPIWEFQNYNVPMPDYLEFDRNLRALGNGSALYGRVDDFMAEHFTQKIFKRWALATGGFAIRAAAADLIPAFAKNPKGITQAKIIQMMDNHGWDMVPGEDESIMAVVGRYVAHKADISQEDFETVAALTKLNGSHVVAASARAGHVAGYEVVGLEEYAKESFYSLKQQVPKQLQVAGEPTSWSAEHIDQYLQWHKQAKDIADQSPAGRAAARAYHDTLYAGDEIPNAATLQLRVGAARHAAAIAAKKVLDAMPEDELIKHKRHHYASIIDEAKPGTINTTKRRWVPGDPGKEGHYEIVGTEEVGQWTVQKPLTNPKGNVPGGMRDEGGGRGIRTHVLGEDRSDIPLSGGTQYGFGDLTDELTGQPLTPSTTVAQKKEWVPAVFGSEGRHEIVEQGENVAVMLDQTRLPSDEIDELFDPHEDWARVMVAALEGTVTGANGAVEPMLLNAIANGQVDQMVLHHLKDLPLEARPNKVFGVYEKPMAPKRFHDHIFGHLNKFINWTAREPVFIDAALDEMRALKPLIGKTMTYDDALTRANARAVQRVLPHIDNAAERSLMAEHTRNFIPFYFAQQQAYARVFRLLQDDPLAFRRVQLGFTQLAEYGGIYDDEQGNSHMIVPGSGFVLGTTMKALDGLGIPVVSSVANAFSGNLRSLASVSPFLEGGSFTEQVIKPGPLVGLGFRAINNVLPETQFITNPIVGEIAASQAWWEMIIPNAGARNVIKATIQSDHRTQATAVLSAIQALEYKQNVEMRKYTEKNPQPVEGTPQYEAWLAKAPKYVPQANATDMERQDFIDRVKNHARVIGVIKAAAGVLLPTAPSAQIGDVALKDELYALMKEKNPDTGQEYGTAGAIQKFLENNPDATPYAVFKTDSQTPSPLDSTHVAQQWVSQNLDFIKDSKYANAASYFVPQTDDEFSQDVYNEQMAMGFRRLKSPEQLIKDIHIGRGNRWYWDKYKPALTEAMATARTGRQKDAVNEEFRTRGNPKKGVIGFDTMKMQNPIWYSNFSSGQRDVQRQLSLSQMRNALDSGAAEDSPMTPKLRALVQQYDYHTGQMMPGRTGDHVSRIRKNEKARWQAQLDAIKTAHPDLTMAINNVFRGL